MSIDDLFNASSALGKLGIVGILAMDVIVLAVAWAFEWAVPRRTFQREVSRADRNLAGWEAATSQFERSLDVIERMQDRRRKTDEST